MIIRIFLVGVLCACGYLMLAQSPQLRAAITDKLSWLDMEDGNEILQRNQINQLKAEIEMLKQQFALEQSEPMPADTDHSAADTSTQEVMPPAPAFGDWGESLDQSSAEDKRKQLMGLAERMEMRALQYGR